jgi:hypothetical protein
MIGRQRGNLSPWLVTLAVLLIEIKLHNINGWQQNTQNLWPMSSCMRNVLIIWLIRFGPPSILTDVAWHQVQHLTQCKDTLNESECVELVDFEENYSFMVQDAVQWYHWSKDQVTYHPIVIYMHQPEFPSKLKLVSLFILSDCMARVTSTFYAFQRNVTQYSKTLDSKMKVILYFSDWAASYHRKNFSNLVNHNNDFGIAAEWHFFATSHSRSPCGTIGGTKKWKAAKPSLQHPYSNQVWEADTQRLLQIFTREYSLRKIFLCQSGRCHRNWKRGNCTLIPTTKEYHCYIPLNSNIVRILRVSGSSIFSDACILRQYSGPTHTA